MRKNKTRTRLLSWLLTLSMMLSLLPGGVFAAGEGDGAFVDAAVFFSDLHSTSSDSKTTMTKAVMGSIAKGLTANHPGEKVSAVFSVGDVFSSNEYQNSGSLSTITNNIVTGLGTVAPSADDVYYTWSDHDRNTEIENFTGLMYGADGNTNYYVYAISMSDMTSSTRYGVASTYKAEKLTAFTNTVKELDKTKPLFVATHVPLHDRRDDNQYADEWFNVINQAAAQMDVIVFWGHNHTSEPSSECDLFFVEPGTKSFAVGNASGSVTPNFTYANAGYLSPSNNETDRKNVATAVTIYEDRINYTTYGQNGEYTGSYAVNEDVERKFAAAPAVLTGITLSGETEYQTGDKLALTVTAAYDDNTTADVTEKATFTCEGLKDGILTKVGTYTVTAAYEGLTATIDITVAPTMNTFTEWDDTGLISVQATALGITGLTVTNVYGDEALCGTFESIFSDYMAVDVALEGHTDGNKIAYSMMVLDEIPVAGLALYHIAEDGTATPITYELVSNEYTSEETGEAMGTSYYLEFTTDLTGVFAYGTVAVPEGYVLSSIDAVNSGETNYFVGETLDLTDLAVTATYTKEGADDFTRILYIQDDYATTDGYTVSGYSMSQVGKQTLVVSYTDNGVTCTDSFEIEVYQKDFSDEKTGITAEVNVFGATELVVANSTNEHVDTAVGHLLVAGTAVSYDIKLVGHVTGETVTVTMPIPEGVANPAVYYVPEDGSAAVNMNATNNGDGTVSFETDHFSTYVVGDGTSIEVPNKQDAVFETETITGEDVTKTVYVLTDSISAGNEYLIVNGNTASSTTRYAIARNNTALSNSGVTIKSADLTGDGRAEIYIELDNATNALWTVGNGYTFENGGYSLYYNRSLSASNRNSSDWTYDNNKLYTGNSYIRYNNGWTVGNQRQGTSLYFYAPTLATIPGATTTIPGATYSIAASIENYTNNEVPVESGTRATLYSRVTKDPTGSGANSYIETASTAKYEIATEGLNGTTVNGDPNGIIEKIDGNTITFTGNAGKALIKVSYTVTHETGEQAEVYNYVVVTASKPTYSVDITTSNTSITGIYEVKAVQDSTTLDLNAAVRRNGSNYTPASGSIEWSIVSGSDVATVDQTGLVDFTGKGGDVVVQVTYTTPSGEKKTDTVTIRATEPGYAVDIQQDGKSVTGTLAKKGVKAGDTIQLSGAATVVDENGNSSTATGGTYTWEIVEGTVATVDNTGKVTFNGEDGIVRVQVTYTSSTNGKTATDIITISAHKSLYTTPADGTSDFPEYPNEGAVHIDKTATAVGSFSQTGITKMELSMTGVPYNNRMDVVLMLDRSSSMQKVSTRIPSTIAATKVFIENIVKNKNGTFNNNRILVMDFLGGNLAQGSQHKYESNSYTLNEESGYQVIGSQEELDALFARIDDKQTGFIAQGSLYGTEYAQGLKGCYDALAASRADGNKQFCVFMSDGIPNYFQGEKTLFESTNSIVNTMYSVNNYTSSSATASRGTGYEYEYYSTQMKK